MASLAVRRSPRRFPLAGLVASAFMCVSLLAGASPASAAAAHRARLSADLADHLSEIGRAHV